MTTTEVKKQVAKIPLEEFVSVPDPDFDRLEQALQQARIDPNIQEEANPVLTTIDGRVFATLRNFSVIMGKAKSKKTFLVTLLVASAMRGTLGVFNTNKFEGKRRIIWFDTEMSRYHVSRSLHRALRLAGGGCMHELEVYDLRPYTPRERVEMISHVTDTNNPDNDIALVVVDGIRDLVTDINCPLQATDTASWLMKLTANKDLHICTVIHQNKGDGHARGHLGSEIVNKAETVVSVTRDTTNQDISLVSADFCRDKDFSPFAFTVGDDGIPYLLEGYQGTAEAEKKKKIIPQTIPKEKHRQLMTEIFSIQPEYGYTDLVIQVKLKYQEYGISLGDNAAKEFLTHCRNAGIVGHNGKGTKGAKYSLLLDTV